MNDAGFQSAEELQVYKPDGTAFKYFSVSYSYDGANKKLVIHSSKSGDTGSFENATPGETACGESKGTDFIVR
jgi:hypothetical protein